MNEYMILNRLTRLITDEGFSIRYVPAIEPPPWIKGNRHAIKPDSTRGVTDLSERTVEIRKDLPIREHLDTICHELWHVRRHRDVKDLELEAGEGRELIKFMEIEAAVASYMILGQLGIDLLHSAVAYTQAYGLTQSQFIDFLPRLLPETRKILAEVERD